MRSLYLFILDSLWVLPAPLAAVREDLSQQNEALAWRIGMKDGAPAKARLSNFLSGIEHAWSLPCFSLNMDGRELPIGDFAFQTTRRKDCVLSLIFSRNTAMGCWLSAWAEICRRLMPRTVSMEGF